MAQSVSIRTSLDLDDIDFTTISAFGRATCERETACRQHKPLRMRSGSARVTDEFAAPIRILEFDLGGAVNKDDHADLAI